MCCLRTCFRSKEHKGGCKVPKNGVLRDIVQQAQPSGSRNQKNQSCCLWWRHTQKRWWRIWRFLFSIVHFLPWNTLILIIYRFATSPDSYYLSFTSNWAYSSYWWLFTFTIFFFNLLSQKLNILVWNYHLRGWNPFWESRNSSTLISCIGEDHQEAKPLHQV